MGSSVLLDLSTWLYESVFRRGKVLQAWSTLEWWCPALSCTGSYHPASCIQHKYSIGLYFANVTAINCILHYWEAWHYSDPLPPPTPLGPWDLAVIDRYSWPDLGLWDLAGVDIADLIKLCSFSIITYSLERLCQALADISQERGTILAYALCELVGLENC